MLAFIRLCAAFVLVAFVCAAIVLRPHAVERWGLYLGSPGEAGATLFLDPFPSAATCESRVKVFTANAERAFCRSHRELEFGTAADAVLAADFDPFSPASWFCSPRRGAKIAQSRPAGGSVRAGTAGL